MRDSAQQAFCVAGARRPRHPVHALAMVVALAGGAVLDLWKREVPGDPVLSYSFLFTLAIPSISGTVTSPSML
jgi:hypothetical protein